MDVENKHSGGFHRIKLVYKTPAGGEITHNDLTSHKEAYDIAKSIKGVKKFTVKQSRIMIIDLAIPYSQWASHVAENSDGQKYDCLIEDGNLVRVERIKVED